MNELTDSAILTKTCQLVQGERATIARVNVKMAQDNISDQLPRYMVPATWLVLEAIPMSISSKLERTLIQRWVETMDAETYAIALGAEKSKSSTVTGKSPALYSTYTFLIVLNVWHITYKTQVYLKYCKKSLHVFLISLPHKSRWKTLS